MNSNKAFSQLEQRLGYVFKNKLLLKNALIHSSHLHDETANNERLEFHGDRVLALIVVDYMFTEYPTAEVGELAIRLNKVVSGKTCSEIAKSIDLGKYLILGHDAKHSGTRTRASVLGGAIEAVIGAVYHDGGLEEARKLVLKLWQPHLSFEVTDAIDPKGKLQERLHIMGKEIPTYRVLKKEGPSHAPEFQVEVSLSSGEKAVSRGMTKKEAERKAAQIILDKWKEASD